MNKKASIFIIYSAAIVAADSIFAPDGEKLYAPVSLSNNVAVVGAGTNRILTKIAVGVGPFNLAVRE